MDTCHQLLSDRKGWIWCLHCERCYRVGEHRNVKPDKYIARSGLIDELKLCFYTDCDGSAELDAFSWFHIRIFHPEYPEEPEQGKVYPLYC